MTASNSYPCRVRGIAENVAEFTIVFRQPLLLLRQFPNVPQKQELSPRMNVCTCTCMLSGAVVRYMCIARSIPLPPLASHPHHHGILRLGHDHATDMHVPLTSPRHANRCLPCYADVVRLRHPPGSHAFEARIELTSAGAVAGAPLDSARTTAAASVGALLGAAVGMGLAAAEGGGLAAAEAGGLAATEAGGRCWRKSGCCHDASCCRVTPALGMALG